MLDVMLQRVCIGNNVNRHFSLNFSKFCNKNNWPQCLVGLSIVILLFSISWSLLNDLSLFEFPLVRRVKLHTRFWSDSCWKHASPSAPIRPQNYGTGLRAPLLLNSKPNPSPQCLTLQSARFLVHWSLNSF